MTKESTSKDKSKEIELAKKLYREKHKEELEDLSDVEIPDIDYTPIQYTFGRPRKYKPEMCLQAIRLGKKGYTKTQICTELGISFETCSTLEKENKDFSEAMRVALQLQEAFYDKLGLENMNNRQFNSRVYELHRMNMHDWNRKADSNITGNISLSALSQRADELE